MWPQELISMDLCYEWLHTLQSTNALIAGGVVLGTGVVGSFIRGQMVKCSLAAKRKKKLAECQKALQQLEQDISSGITSSERQNILELNLEQLIVKLQTGEVTPTQALQAYQGKALEVNKTLNCLVEPIVEAKLQAKSLEHSRQKGPLYGVPVSIKDNYGIKGYDCVVGCSRFIDQPYEDDSVVVQILRKQGALLFVKTNVPQTMISWETTNPVFGPTRNPHDVTRGVGGSSGGEGSLIAGGGSLIGFGSDIGGSIRIPSSMCGVYGLKPTEMRISNRGTAPILSGQTCLGAAYGPLARDVDSLVTVMKAICIPEMSQLDPMVPHIPFNDQVYNDKRRLRIGYFLQDGYFHAVPAMERGVLEAKEALERMGHELVPWEYPNLGYSVINIWGNAIFGDGGKEMKDLLCGDAIDSSMKSPMLLISIPECVRKSLYYIIRLIFPAMALPLKASIGLKTVSNWWNLMKETNAFRVAVANDWKDKGLDVVLCPGFGCPAIEIGQAGYATGAASYTMLYNVLNFPAGSQPVTKVTAEDNAALKDYPLKDLWHRVVKKCMKGSEGLPINVQVAALPWQEELVLRVMKDIETALKH